MRVQSTLTIPYALLFLTSSHQSLPPSYLIILPHQSSLPSASASFISGPLHTRDTQEQANTSSRERVPMSDAGVERGRGRGRFVAGCDRPSPGVTVVRPAVVCTKISLQGGRGSLAKNRLSACARFFNDLFIPATLYLTRPMPPRYVI